MPNRPVQPLADQPLNSPSVPESLRYLDQLTRLMDTAFRVPGTQIRFGLDAMIGLIPGLGEGVSLVISGGLVLAMFRHGVSGPLLLRMVGNMALDALVGSIPILGDLFDVAYKANRRNLKLLLMHHEQGKPTKPALPYVVAAALLIALLPLVFIALFVWGMAALLGAM
ncbi:MAG: DUF4112 domain-containing protein [Bacteroidetes bacterium]|nr:DUF4112 domain-containing protein [Bacteroidota bacterium]